MRALLLASVVLAACSGVSGSGDPCTPELAPLEDQEAAVDDTMILDLGLLSACGDEAWSFSAPSVPGIDGRAGLYPAGDSATFRWALEPADVGVHELTFTVTSGDESDSVSIDVEVTAP